MLLGKLIEDKKGIEKDPEDGCKTNSIPSVDSLPINSVKLQVQVLENKTGPTKNTVKNSSPQKPKLVDSLVNKSSPVKPASKSTSPNKPKSEEIASPNIVTNIVQSIESRPEIIVTSKSVPPLPSIQDKNKLVQPVKTGNKNVNSSPPSQSKIWSQNRDLRFRNVFKGESSKIEQGIQNIATSNIPGDQNCIQCNHMYVATGVQVSLIRNYYFSIVLYLI